MGEYSGMCGDVTIVTGASGQIGREIVTQLTRSRHKIVAVDISIDQLRKAADELGWTKDVQLIRCDISKTEDVINVFEVCVKQYGYVQNLINNAGVSVFDPFLDRTEEQFDWVVDVNLKGTFLCIREFLRRCDPQSDFRKAIVNVASHYGVISPDPRIYTDCERRNSEVYGATKAGIIQMTKYFAVHAANYYVRVNCVSPGGVLNPVTPQGEDFQRNYSYRCPMSRMGETREIVDPILFLLSPAASYINGHNLVVDGGMTSW